MKNNLIAFLFLAGIGTYIRAFLVAKRLGYDLNMEGYLYSLTHLDLYNENFERALSGFEPVEKPKSIIEDENGELQYYDSFSGGAVSSYTPLRDILIVSTVTNVADEDDEDEEPEDEELEHIPVDRTRPSDEEGEEEEPPEQPEQPEQPEEPNTNDNGSTSDDTADIPNGAGGTPEYIPETPTIEQPEVVNPVTGGNKVPNQNPANDRTPSQPKNPNGATHTPAANTISNPTGKDKITRPTNLI